MTDDRLSYLIDMIRHRVPEATEADLALLAPPPDPDMLPASILQQVVEVIDKMAARQDRFEAQLAPEALRARLH
jgi:hypothetical protein